MTRFAGTDEVVLNWITAKLNLGLTFRSIDQTGANSGSNVRITSFAYAEVGVILHFEPVSSGSRAGMCSANSYAATSLR
jgi:hypothetical protein